MKLHRIIPRKVSTSFAVGAAYVLALAACGGGSGGGGAYGSISGSQMTQQTMSGFVDTALVSNKTGVVATTTTIDANLSNPWGLVTAKGLPFWIADNNSNVASLYSGTGQIQTNAVTGSTTTAIAIPASATGVAANPTGQVYNGIGGFLIPTSNGQETSLFIFSGEGGTIAGWAKDSGATAATAYDDGVVDGTAHAVAALAVGGGAVFMKMPAMTPETYAQ